MANIEVIRSATGTDYCRSPVIQVLSPIPDSPADSFIKPDGCAAGIVTIPSANGLSAGLTAPFVRLFRAFARPGKQGPNTHAIADAPFTGQLAANRARLSRVAKSGPLVQQGHGSQATRRLQVTRGGGYHSGNGATRGMPSGDVYETLARAHQQLLESEEAAQLLCPDVPIRHSNALLQQPRRQQQQQQQQQQGQCRSVILPGNLHSLSSSDSFATSDDSDLDINVIRSIRDAYMRLGHIQKDGLEYKVVELLDEQEEEVYESAAVGIVGDKDGHPGLKPGMGLNKPKFVSFSHTSSPSTARLDAAAGALLEASRQLPLQQNPDLVPASLDVSSASSGGMVARICDHGGIGVDLYAAHASAVAACQTPVFSPIAAAAAAAVNGGGNTPRAFGFSVPVSPAGNMAAPPLIVTPRQQTAAAGGGGGGGRGSAHVMGFTAAAAAGDGGAGGGVERRGSEEVERGSEEEDESTVQGDEDDSDDALRGDGGGNGGRRQRGERGEGGGREEREGKEGGGAAHSPVMMKVRRDSICDPLACLLPLYPCSSSLSSSFTASVCHLQGETRSSAGIMAWCPLTVLFSSLVRPGVRSRSS